MNNEKKDLEIKKKPQQITDADLDKVNGGLNPCAVNLSTTDCNVSTFNDDAIKR